jgi:hypothetical protein
MAKARIGKATTVEANMAGVPFESGGPANRLACS